MRRKLDCRRLPQRLPLHAATAMQRQNIFARSKAGGISIHSQITAYGGRDDDLYTQAIVESGTLGGNYSLPGDAAYQTTYNSVITSTNCSSTANSSASIQLSCIRSLPIDEFRQASVGTTGSLFDGDLLNVPGSLAAYRAGNWTRVSFLVGSNTDEGRSFAPSGANTTTDVAEFMSTIVPPDQINATLQQYPDVPAIGCPFNTGDFQLDPVQNGVYAPPGTQDKRTSAIVGDVVMAAAPRWLAQEVSYKVPFWKYRFNHKPYDISFGVEDFVGHFVEVAYVFNTQNNDTDFWITNHATATYLGPPAPIGDRFLGVYMSRTWAAFAATGDPNNANVATKINWPRYSQGGENMVFQTQGSVLEKDDYRQQEMQFIMDNIFFYSAGVSGIQQWCSMPQRSHLFILDPAAAAVIGDRAIITD
ncbi:Alpha/Beta hydrolase protein [Mycena galericulata]|nr:Alpha/Beta hydrolase protein [Mycena galericulata]